MPYPATARYPCRSTLVQRSGWRSRRSVGRPILISNGGRLRGCQRCEEGELFRAVGGGFGVVDGEHQPFGATDCQLLSSEDQLAGLRMMYARLRALAGEDVVAGPELPETLAGQGQLADELDESWVVGIGPDRLPESGDQGRGGFGPVRIQRLLGRVKKYVAEPITTDLQVG